MYGSEKEKLFSGGKYGLDGEKSVH